MLQLRSNYRPAWRKQSRRTKWVVLSLCFLLLLTGMRIYSQRNGAHREMKKAVASLVEAEPTAAVEAAIQPSTYAWKGAASEPERLLIPRLQVDGYVESLGIGASNDVAVPSNIHLAGWFNKSARPGDRGLSVIDGHLDGPHTPDGIFSRLGTLRTGDAFSVTRGDGHQRHER